MIAPILYSIVSYRSKATRGNQQKIIKLKLDFVVITEACRKGNATATNLSIVRGSSARVPEFLKIVRSEG